MKASSTTPLRCCSMPCSGNPLVWPISHLTSAGTSLKTSAAAAAAAGCVSISRLLDAICMHQVFTRDRGSSRMSRQA